MIDYLEGREVEVSSIWKEPLSRARQLGVATPEIDRLVSEIEHALAEKKN